MIRASLDTPEVLAAQARLYRAGRIPGAVLPAALEPATAAGLRTRLSSAGFTPFWVADRGRFAANDTLEDRALFEHLRDVAEEISAERLELEGFCWLLLRRGDYALLKHGRPPARRSLELTLDFSAASTGEAEIVYGDGRERLFVVPQLAEGLALVERGPEASRYERYLTARVGDARVFRLRLVLAPR